MDTALIVCNYECAKLGLRIIFPATAEDQGEDLGNSFIQNIYFISSAKAKTKNGSILNKFTPEDVLKALTKPHNQY